ncbi:aldehyde dehydrogenase family protein [Granulicella arctica]|uniref:aldehyde dehydrogenase family protein n=1 Tax=Granulicella arctica TaxID=940613 RepID=UPI0021DFAC94|nr:aldehyde dehydrogenase family protein [Granulicella arctica]
MTGFKAKPFMEGSAGKVCQIAWAAQPLEARLKVLRKTRHELSRLGADVASAISPILARTAADTRIAELLPLLDACRFLERQAKTILATRRLRRRGLPFWLSGVESEIERVPFGQILVIGPSNYPLFIPGVQVLQALIAGNSVTWKPGRGGQTVAELVAEVMIRAGLPQGLLQVTEDTVGAASAALARNPDKVFFTGSADVGRILMRQLADTLTPSVMELSGCDAVIVLPSADLSRVIQALTFGMRLNGSATCMAPRRVLLVEASAARREAFLIALQIALSEVLAIRVSSDVRRLLETLLQEAMRNGAHVLGDMPSETMKPIVVTGVLPDMRIAQADIFAPVLSVIDVPSQNDVIAAQAACPFVLTASIFGDEQQARKIAVHIVAGSVLINDIIVPTADPRLPFSGRRESGFGSSRGAEGLLEMTSARTIAVRNSKSVRHYEATTTAHESLFDGLITSFHGRGLAERWRGLRQVAAAGKQLAKRK